MQRDSQDDYFFLSSSIHLPENFFWVFVCLFVLLVTIFLRNCYTNFHSDYTNLHSHQQWMSVPFTPHPLQHKLSLVLLMLAILMGVKYNLKVILASISLMANDVEHFFKCFSVI